MLHKVTCNTKWRSAIASCLHHGLTRKPGSCRYKGFSEPRYHSSTSSSRPDGQRVPKMNALDKGKAKPFTRRQPTLRSAALEATVSQVGSEDTETVVTTPQKKLVMAYCLATRYNLEHVEMLLRDRGFSIDPCNTGLTKQVIHVEVPLSPTPEPQGCEQQHSPSKKGDIFAFPSGNVVAWNIPQGRVLTLVREALEDAEEGHHQVEDEHFEYVEDLTREKSFIQNDTIILGTMSTYSHSRLNDVEKVTRNESARQQHVNTVLAKIAFSSGLARSTKLAVLENRLETYLEDTKSIPEKLMDGNLVSYSRSFIYQKMGQLLDLRRQLNLSSDITDALPDVFWDARADLELDNYYDHMSRALDTEQRILSLNQKMDYAHEIASILREELSVIREQQSERHSTRLEWIIILLITVEVMFGSFDLYQKLQASSVSVSPQSNDDREYG